MVTAVPFDYRIVVEPGEMHFIVRREEYRFCALNALERSAKK